MGVQGMDELFFNVFESGLIFFFHLGLQCKLIFEAGQSV